MNLKRITFGKMSFEEKYLEKVLLFVCNQLLNLNQWESYYHIKVKDTNDSRFIL